MESLWQRECEDLNMELVASLVRHIHTKEVSNILLVSTPKIY
jgi:hypothetical protein